uniref:Uncharacterized protein n=1 Tax=Bactrocera latifrons TaxID=174628 RepID=A0A0K8VIE6_BACLA
MERHRTLDSSMSSLYSGSNVSNTPSAQRQQHDNYNYPTLSSSTSPTPSAGGTAGISGVGLLTGASSTNALATAGGSNSTNATARHASELSLCSGEGGVGGGLRATTIGTVVVRCGPIQLVIALLQVRVVLF